MSNRYGRRDVEEALEHFCRVAGVPYGTSYNDGVGVYYVDKYIGGYKICQYDGQGQREPFGSHRRPAKEMVHTLWFATHAIDVAMRAKEDASSD